MWLVILQTAELETKAKYRKEVFSKITRMFSWGDKWKFVRSI
jgi:hypothetical protein